MNRPSELNQDRFGESLRQLQGRRNPPLVMAILNVTPDSFSDGGRFVEPAAAFAQAERMIGEGADIIDVGPESTRPGAEPVSASVQIERAVPVIKAIRERFADTTISIDTRSAEVAEAALAAGANIVNDVSAMRDDDRMTAVVRDHGAGVVLMHMRGEPATMQTAGGGPRYTDVVEEVFAFLRERIDFAVAAGVDRTRIIVDPGIGFGKTVDHNLALLRRLDRLCELDVPVLIGASRKRFIDAVADVPEAGDRMPGSLAAAVVAVMNGVSIIRTHDVAATRQAVRVTRAIRESGS